jgi:hypothetical protein
MAVSLTIPRKRLEQLSLGQLMVLTGGAAIGMAVYQSARHNLQFNIDLGWKEVVFACYLSLAGVAMAAAVMLAIERFRWRRPWSPPAVALFVAGLVAWCQMPFCTSTFLVLSSSEPAHKWFDKVYLAYEPGTLSLVGFSEIWPLVSIALLVACAASGQAPRWWQLRGAWSQWLGMWMLAAWSLPAVHAIYRAATFVPLPPEMR